MIALAYAVALAGASSSLVVLQSRTGNGRVTVKRETIIRVPAAPRAQRRIKWKEKDAPKCIAWSRMAAAMISSPTTIDVVVKGGTRYRVKFEKSCQAADFYSGFYVNGNRDGMVCQDRDMMHARSGGACMISKFKTLIADK